MKKRIFTLVLTLFVYGMTEAQNFEWGVHFGGIGEDVVRAMAVDEEGNVYTTGYFTDLSDFDPGENTATLTAEGFYDIFVQKLDENGNLLWAKGFGGPWFDYGTGIEVDAIGNVYITGVYQDTVDFDPGEGVFELISNGGEDIFILKLSPEGEFLWAAGMGSEGYEEPVSVGVDGFGNIYVAGYFMDPIDFDPSAETYMLESNGGQDGFLVKLNSQGDFQWAYAIGGEDQDLVLGMAVHPSGSTFLTGYFNGSVDFDPWIGEQVQNATGSRDGFILKFGPLGDFVYVAVIDGDEGITPWDVAVDADENAYSGGGFFGDLIAGSTTLTSQGNEDAFAVKVDPMGNIVWANAVQGNEFQNAYDIACDTEGNVIIAGYFMASTDFNPAGNEPFIMDNQSSQPFDAFYVKYDTEGTFVSAAQFGGSDFLEHHGVGTNAAGDIYLSSAFQGTVDLNPDPDETLNATAVEFRDTYIIKLSSGPVSNTPDYDLMSMDVFPNPANEFLHISDAGTGGQVPYRIYDQSGRKLISGMIHSKSAVIDVDALSSGFYILQLEGYLPVKWIKE